MSIQFIHKKSLGTETSPTSITDTTAGKAIIRNLSRAAGLAYDRSANFFKYNGNDAIKTLVDAESTQSITGAKTFTSPVLTTPTIAAPTGVVSIADAGATIKELLNSAAKTIVDGSATGLFSVAVPAGPAAIGGMGVFLVRATDAGGEQQVIAGIFTYSAETKATVVVGTITYVAANEAKAVSSGTLTLAFTADVSVANVVTYKLQPTGSLTETAPYTIEYTLFPVRGVVTVL